MHTWAWDIASGHVTWSPGIEELVGVPPGSFGGTFEAYQAVLHPNDRDAVVRAVAEAVENPKAGYEVEHRVVLPDGTLRWLSCRGYVQRGADGAPLKMLGVVFEVTARKEAEDALRRSEDRFRRLIEHAPDAVFLVDDSLRYIDVNDAACSMLGYTRDELLALRLPDLLPPGALEERPVALDAAVVGQTRTSERTLVRKDGSFVSVEIAGTVLPGRMLQSFVRDIGARKSLEARLVRAERLASLGRLAGGVAHEINNPLAYVQLNLEIIRKHVGTLPSDVNARLGRAITESLDGAERMRRIVRSLADFSRGEEEPLTPVDVNAALDAAIHMTENKIRHRARLIRSYGAYRCARANEYRLGQVFVNLLVNAADAIPDGDVEHHEIRVTTRMGLAGVVIEISDTGTGIPPEARERLFDPFFTTKPVGMGTGLGLSICHSIVSSFGGSISVQSPPGKGATFEVVLPVADVDSKAPRQRPPSVPLRRVRILVVDDEPAITRVISELLSDHDVTIATNGSDARRLCAERSFDCILCDVMMPEMGGLDVHAALQADGHGHEQRIVFMTGGAFVPRERDFLATVDNPCLEKPFTPCGLEEAIAVITRRHGMAPP